jgi:tripartite-type tricarboxylate transporter receptor subunit TctC
MMNSKSEVGSRKSEELWPKRFAASFLFPLLFSFGLAAAQQYPTKPIRLVVPLAPGGGNDTIARMIGAKIQGPLGQQIVVENGYTLLLANVATQTIIPNLHPHVAYSPLRDFQPISLIAQAPHLVAVHPSLPVVNIRQLVAFAKSKPGQLNYASNGVGSSTHFATELFKLMTGTKMEHVPYKGLSLAMIDLVTGRVHLMFSSAVAMLPNVKEGKLRAIAMTSSQRSPAIPQIPTVAESGVKDFESGSWYGIVVPTGTPRPIVDRLHKEIAAAVRSQEVQDRLLGEAVIPVGGTPEEFGAHIKKEFTRAARVIKESGAKFE